MQMIPVRGIILRAEDSLEPFAARRADVAEEALFLVTPAPSRCHRDVPAISEDEAADINRVGRRMFGALSGRLGPANHVAAGIGPHRFELHDRTAKPLPCRRLHRALRPEGERFGKRALDRFDVGNRNANRRQLD